MHTFLKPENHSRFKKTKIENFLFVCHRGWGDLICFVFPGWGPSTLFDDFSTPNPRSLPFARTLPPPPGLYIDRCMTWTLIPQVLHKRTSGLRTLRLKFSQKDTIYQENMRGQRGTLPVHTLWYVIVTKVIYRLVHKQKCVFRDVRIKTKVSA